MCASDPLVTLCTYTLTFLTFVFVLCVQHLLLRRGAGLLPFLALVGWQGPAYAAVNAPLLASMGYVAGPKWFPWLLFFASATRER